MAMIIVFLLSVNPKMVFPWNCRVLSLSLPLNYHVGCDATKPVFGVSDKARLKPVSPATETS